ncbi:MAG: DUF4430 domain-containing protein [Ruminococcus sp.]|nr:DUF4430 domain-containing protein [Ruminococcus sp.]
MKKFLSTLAAAVLCVACLVSCGNSSSAADTSSSKAAASSSAADSSVTESSSSEADSSNAEDSSKAEESSNADSSSANDAKSQAELTIDVSDINANYDMLEKGLQSEEFVPKSGKILEGKSVEITDGMTAFQLLTKVCESKNIKVESKNTDYGMYVSGINNVSEGSCGKASGWMFKVNGKDPGVGADACKLQAGDKVEFFYICDYNKYYANQTTTEATTQAAA